MRAALSPPPIVRAAEVATGAVFIAHGRPLRVVRTTGADAAAPVILEELVAWGHSLRGQFAIWSHADVLRAITESHI